MSQNQMSQIQMSRFPMSQNMMSQFQIIHISRQCQLLIETQQSSIHLEKYRTNFAEAEILRILDFPASKVVTPLLNIAKKSFGIDLHPNPTSL